MRHVVQELAAAVCFTGTPGGVGPEEFALTAANLLEPLQATLRALGGARRREAGGQRAVEGVLDLRFARPRVDVFAASPASRAAL